MRNGTALLGLLVTGCSLGIVSDPSGGDDNLPILGGGPFAKPPIDFDTTADEPYVITVPLASVSEPTVLDRADGGFTLWFTRQVDGAPEAEIWTSGVPSIFDLPDVVPGPALVSDQDWEQGRVAAPSVAQLADGTLIMMYEGGIDAPAVGVARSTDGGQSWTKNADNPVIDDAITPSIADSGQGLLAAFTRPDERRFVFAADSSDGDTWQVRDEALLRARLEDSTAFDFAGVSSPNLSIREQVGGRLHYGLHVVGEDIDGALSIGFAGSFDGVSFERFGGLDPVLSNLPPSERGPALSVRGPTAYLFFEQERQLRGAIAVAVQPRITVQ